MEPDFWIDTNDNFDGSHTTTLRKATPNTVMIEVSASTAFAAERAAYAALEALKLWGNMVDKFVIDDEGKSSKVEDAGDAVQNFDRDKPLEVGEAEWLIRKALCVLDTGSLHEDPRVNEVALQALLAVREARRRG